MAHSPDKESKPSFVHSELPVEIILNQVLIISDFIAQQSTLLAKLFKYGGRNKTHKSANFKSQS